MSDKERLIKTPAGEALAALDALQAERLTLDFSTTERQAIIDALQSESRSLVDYADFHQRTGNDAQACDLYADAAFLSEIATRFERGE